MAKDPNSTLNSGRELEQSQDPLESELQCSGEYLDSDYFGHPDEDYERIQQLLELKCKIQNCEEYDFYYSSRTIDCNQGKNEGVEPEFQLLNEEVRNIEFGCKNIMQAHRLQKVRDKCEKIWTFHDGEVQNYTTSMNIQGGKLEDIVEHPEKSDKDSSSAYNTAESCRSTLLTMDRSPDNSLPRMMNITNKKNLRVNMITNHSSSGESSNESTFTKGKTIAHGCNSESKILGISKLSGQEKTANEQISPYLSPYHSSLDRYANSPAHPRHYQSYMQKSIIEYPQSQLSLMRICKESQKCLEPKMEWKVKIRSDGTRYITKRPVRDRILKERALKIKEERSGMTTDDDTISEMKMGRYWSKEERKQHLVCAKEQRRRREFMMRSRLEYVKETPQSSSEGKREINIIELSHKKMMKKRNKKILDNWMTIQELMTHGTKSPDGTGVHNAFLSVTTV